MTKVPLMLSERNETLEIYKLRAGFADRLSERPEGAPRLFLSLLTALLVLLAASLRFGTGDVSADAVVLFCGAASVLLSTARFMVLRSDQILARASSEPSRKSSGTSPAASVNGNVCCYRSEATDGSRKWKRPCLWRSCSCSPAWRFSPRCGGRAGSVGNDRPFAKIGRPFECPM